ncbi:MAG: hypothetical protein QMD36_03805 [Candidatus Aenigmarchaeota archaeon]|nr:hypothetical protein [Candidatus Aenigmarchaeota archaeon]
MKEAMEFAYSRYLAAEILKEGLKAAKKMDTTSGKKLLLCSLPISRKALINRLCLLTSKIKNQPKLIL